ncbi:hypothetical protein E2C01_082571 [Portunus trituberculatus]|uniref:Uncharacterized protein n=1 Tax=Portunus trituberculatus TaxID=210409 RepID=A0A5B7IZH3_PORTR|nr:hypothetical protein [Portunus trituberculatus]
MWVPKKPAADVRLNKVPQRAIGCHLDQVALTAIKGANYASWELRHTYISSLSGKGQWVGELGRSQ